MMSCPREVGDRIVNQLALTFGTLLSSQSTGAHPWKSLDRLRGNLIYVTGLARQLQIVSAVPIPTLLGDACVVASVVTEVDRRVVPRAVQLPRTCPVRPLCGSPRGMDEVTGPLPAASNLQVSDLLHDHFSESVQVGGPSRDRTTVSGCVG